MKTSVQTRLARQEMIADTYEIHFRSDKKRFIADTHFHDFIELHYVTKGTTRVQIGNVTFNAQPGDFFFYMPNQLHNNIYSDCTEPYERYVLWIGMKYLRSLSSGETDILAFFNKPEHCVVRFSPTEKKQVRDQFDKLQRIQFEVKFGSDLLKNAYITELLVTVARLIEQQGDFYNSSFVKKNDLISCVDAYIQDHISEKISIEDLAEHAFLSKSRFCSQFKESTGITIHKFITYQRLMKSRDLVLDGGALTDAYLQCGFGDYSSFYRAFKSEFGVSPREYFHNKVDRRQME